MNILCKLGLHRWCTASVDKTEGRIRTLSEHTFVQTVYEVDEACMRCGYERIREQKSSWQWKKT